MQVELGDRLEESQLVLPTPCAGWSVREVLNHSIGVTLKFAEFASGATDRPRPPAGDLLGADHRVALRAAAASSKVAWASVDATRRVDLSFGVFSTDLAAGINLFDLLAHTWDIAVATGLAVECPDRLWLEGLEAAQAVIGAERDLDHYAAERPVAGSAPARVRFLAFLGRG
jgi:uncharacterized protein (TIGR03086 family)